MSSILQGKQTNKQTNKQLVFHIHCYSSKK